MEDLIKRLEIPDVALFTLSSEDGYVGMEKDFDTRAWWAVVAADVMEDIRSMILVNDFGQCGGHRKSRGHI
jgi:predicted nucleotide-binding protein (sugar kinase/HSP70/actin superfamily)